MAPRIARVAQEALDNQGIEVLSSLTGNSRSGTINLLDPNETRQARRILAKVGIKSKNTTATTLEVNAADEEDDDVSQLISSWREFAKESSSAGYRKAARVSTFPKPPKTSKALTIVAKRVIDHLKRWAHTYPPLRVVAHSLQKALKGNNRAKVTQILADLSGGPDRAPRPIIRNPNQPPEELDTPFEPSEDYDTPYDQEPQELQQASPIPEFQQRHPTPATARRRLTAHDTHAMTNSATRFIQDYINENNLGPTEIKKLAKIGGDAYDSWKASLPNVPDGVAQALWSQAVQIVQRDVQIDQRRGSVTSHEIEDGLEFIEDSPPVTADSVFSPCTAMDQRRSSKDMVKLVGDIIVHFTPEVHPEDITLEQLREYLQEHAPDVDPERAHKVLEHVVKGGIPDRENALQRETSKRRKKKPTARRIIDVPRGRLVHRTSSTSLRDF